jgi:hypothetical protein
LLVGVDEFRSQEQGTAVHADAVITCPVYLAVPPVVVLAVNFDRIVPRQTVACWKYADIAFLLHL